MKQRAVQKEKNRIYQLLTSSGKVPTRSDNQSDLGWRDHKTKQPLRPDGERSIPLIDRINDGDGEVTIAYVPGEAEIHLHKQTDKNAKKKTIGDLNFRGGFAFVKASEQNKIRFLDKTYQCLNNNPPSHRTPIYRLLDGKTEAEKNNKKEAELVLAQSKAFHGDWKDVSEYCIAKGINMDRSPSEIRHDLNYQIKHPKMPITPEEFLEELGSESIRLLARCAEAIESGKVVSVDESSRKIVWTSNRGLICTYNVNQTAKDALFNIITNHDGVDVKEAILSSFGEGKSSSKETIDEATIIEMDAKSAVEIGISMEVLRKGNDDCYRLGAAKCGVTMEKILEHFTDEEKGKDRLQNLKEALVEKINQ